MTEQDKANAATLDPTTIEIQELREKGQKYAPENSSNINLATYDVERKLLLIDFKSGKPYIYVGVEQNVFDDLIKAESAGKFLNASIKGNYEFVRIEMPKGDGAQRIEDEPARDKTEDRGENAQSVKSA